MRRQRTAEQEAAVNEWIEAIKPPEIAQEAIRNKFYRINITPEEIRADMKAKLANMEG